MTGIIALGVLGKIVDYFCGTSVLACCIDLKWYCIPNSADSLLLLSLAQASVRHRGSISSHPPLTRHRTDSQATGRYRSNSNLSSQSVDVDSIEHPVESRTRTAELPPVMSKAVDDDPLCWIGFEEDCIITSCAEGHIRTWDRPKEAVNESQTTLSGVGSNT